jgi:hypothetical protein
VFCLCFFFLDFRTDGESPFRPYPISSDCTIGAFVNLVFLFMNIIFRGFSLFCLSITFFGSRTDGQNPNPYIEFPSGYWTSVVLIPTQCYFMISVYFLFVCFVTLFLVCPLRTVGQSVVHCEISVSCHRSFSSGKFYHSDNSFLPLNVLPPIGLNFVFVCVCLSRFFFLFFLDLRTDGQTY